MGELSYKNANQSMHPKDLIALIEQGAVEKMAIGRPTPNLTWSVAAYGVPLPRGIVNRIELNQEGCIRMWADLDAAYGFIRKCGFQGPILIDG